jgi:dolichyl-phosphate-mannose-protein mannosyltransferase
MMTSNNALVPDPDKQDDLASQFWQWPILHVGLRMCSWDDNSKFSPSTSPPCSLQIPRFFFWHSRSFRPPSAVKYFLLGNPLVYWGSTASLAAFGLLLAWYVIRWQRGYDELKPADVDHIHYSGVYPVVGWFLHYLPFVLMARVTYVHHYYPALYFAILTFGFCVDWATRRWSATVRWAVYALLYVAVTGLFVLFKDFCFGMVGSHTQWKHLKWFDRWRMTD